MNVDLATAAGDVFASCSHVILHVSGAEDAAGIDIFKAGKNLLGRALGDMGDYVEASAMAHAHDQLDGAKARGGVEDFID